MIYLDYSATTMASEEVLESFLNVEKKYIGNPNSFHKLGVEAKSLIENATTQIKEVLDLKDSEIIYTSSATEANNLAIKGILKHKNRGKHIITTLLEHSSIFGSIEYLKELGYEVDYVNIDEHGILDLNHLHSLLREDTVLVAVNAINSEIGIIQPIFEIGEIVKKYQKCIYHVDATQAVGKIKLDYSNVDTLSMSAHKFFGMKGIGLLAKKKNLDIEPLIHGGKSITNFRAGTPTTALIVSIAKALRLESENLDERFKYITELNDIIIDAFKSYDNIYINSNQHCIPHIINISVIGIKPETILHALEEFDIYISTQTACSEKEISSSILSLTNSKERANSSLRISLSYKTTKKDIETFLEKFDIVHKKLMLK